MVARALTLSFNNLSIETDYAAMTQIKFKILVKVFISRPIDGRN